MTPRSPGGTPARRMASLSGGRINVGDFGVVDICLEESGDTPLQQLMLQLTLLRLWTKDGSLRRLAAMLLASFFGEAPLTCLEGWASSRRGRGARNGHEGCQGFAGPCQRGGAAPKTASPSVNVGP